MDCSTQCRYAQLASLYISDNILLLVSAGQDEVVSELVGAGADVNRKNDKGITPLFVSQTPAIAVFSLISWSCRHYAASKSRIEVWITLAGRFWMTHTHFSLDWSLFNLSRSRRACCI